MTKTNRKKLMYKIRKERESAPKWAQMSKLERAWAKLETAKQWDIRGRALNKLEARERNRYYQLAGHWVKLKKESGA